jgi:hypothetical protein
MHCISPYRLTGILGLRSHVCTPCKTHAAILTSLFHGENSQRFQGGGYSILAIKPLISRLLKVDFIQEIADDV